MKQAVSQSLSRACVRQTTIMSVLPTPIVPPLTSTTALYALAGPPYDDAALIRQQFEPWRGGMPWSENPQELPKTDRPLEEERSHWSEEISALNNFDDAWGMKKTTQPVRSVTEEVLRHLTTTEKPRRATEKDTFDGCARWNGDARRICTQAEKARLRRLKTLLRQNSLLNQKLDLARKKAELMELQRAKLRVLETNEVDGRRTQIVSHDPYEISASNMWAARALIFTLAALTVTLSPGLFIVAVIIRLFLIATCRLTFLSQFLLALILETTISIVESRHHWSSTTSTTRRSHFTSPFHYGENDWRYILGLPPDFMRSEDVAQNRMV